MKPLQKATKFNYTTQKCYSESLFERILYQSTIIYFIGRR